MMFKRKGGGGKGLLKNVQKNCTFLTRWLPSFNKTKWNFHKNKRVHLYLMCQILLKKYIQRTNYDMAALVQPIKVSASLYTAMYIPDTSVLPVTVPLAMNEVLIPDTWNPLIMKNGDVTVASLAASETAVVQVAST